MSHSSDAPERADTTLYLDCPVCKAKTMQSTVHTYAVPYFGDIIENVMLCEGCSFRHVDVFIPGVNEPQRHELAITGEADMRIRVARSNSATIRLDDLGILIEPGPASEAYISNVEGVLERIRDVLVRTIVLCVDGDEGKKRALELSERIGRIIDGTECANLVIDDPQGNSAIIAEKVVIRRLTDAECASLRQSVQIIDTAAECTTEDTNDHENSHG